jgi:hypothetical protein
MSINTAFFLICSLLLIAACHHEPVASNVVSGQKNFFDLKGYFDGEIQRLQSIGSRAKKVVLANGKHEEQIVHSINFQQELSVFSESDVNRPAWSDKYVVDTAFNEQRQISHLHIKAIDEKLKTHKIDIDFKNTFVTRILIENNSSSSIASSSQVLIYEPRFGYSIESNQKVAMSDGQIFKVVVQFLK